MIESKAQPSQACTFLVRETHLLVNSVRRTGKKNTLFPGSAAVVPYGSWKDSPSSALITQHLLSTTGAAGGPWGEMSPRGRTTHPLLYILHWMKPCRVVCSLADRSSEQTKHSETGRLGKQSWRLFCFITIWSFSLFFPHFCVFF